MNKSPKLYVRVCTMFEMDGRMRPQYLVLEDGRKFEIDKVLDVKPAHAQKAGGCGDRYTVRIKGQERYLFFEHSTMTDVGNPGKWFVECQN